ncbi:MAG: 30S ribosome-binding factor RbfA [Oligoflexia bacterium]|nr:30S ribosome-binding factor RbfA [Oligoflexia bacterium]
MASPRRVHKVAEKVRGLIAMELQRVADPRFSLVTITSAVVSRDLRHVKVYWMVTGNSVRRAEVEQAFEGATGLFRRLLADGLGTRFVPDMRFYYDDTLDASDEIDRLLAKIRTDAPMQLEEE